MRARLPDRSGTITRDGIASAYDIYGEEHATTVLLLPAWAIVHGLHWKMQVPVLSRRYRVITMDGRGNGRSDRPRDPAAYTVDEYLADALAVLNDTGTDRAIVAGVSLGGWRAAALAAEHPDRILGAVLIAPEIPHLGTTAPARTEFSFLAELDTDEGWAIFNQHAWRRDFPAFADFFWRQIFTEDHSSKPIEDGIGWTLETDAETLIATVLAGGGPRSHAEAIAQLQGISCPMLVVHGTDDHVTPTSRGLEAAEITGADLLLIEGGGHCPQARDPIRVNRALLSFLDRVTPAQYRSPQRTTWIRALRRRRKILYLSSPIGLGHARRDLAIARHLRQQLEDVQIDWLAQHPVTAFLSAADERVHPGSRQLVSESAHIEAEAGEHELHAFQAIRRMDEVLLSNFSLFQDIVDGGEYDLVIADEAWDVDHFWHENPELKCASFVWMSDFVGWLPMPEGGAPEAALTAYYNAEMIKHVERFRRIRDRSIFVGDPEDIVPDDFGPGLPSIRAWTEQHFDFSGYITGLDADAWQDRSALRHRLGVPGDVPYIVVTVGGSGVGAALLRKVIDGYPRLRKELGDLRMLVVAGPRIDTACLPEHCGVDIRGFLPELAEHLAACDAAIVQGGLTTTMELVAARRPFLYFPLGQHFEQQRHVRHRLHRYGAGRCLDYATTDADEIADALAQEMAGAPDYRSLPTDGAARAARMISELL